MITICVVFVIRRKTLHFQNKINSLSATIAEYEKIIEQLKRDKKLLSENITALKDENESFIECSKGNAGLIIHRLIQKIKSLNDEIESLKKGQEYRDSRIFDLEMERKFIF